MPNVTVLCTKCNHEFTVHVKTIDTILHQVPGTCPSCPICRRKKWLRLVKPHQRGEAEGF